MLLVEANRQCLQKLLSDFPEVCSALHLTEPYWEENAMVLRVFDPNIYKVLKKYFRSESIQKKLLPSIPVEKFILETIPTIKETPINDRLVFDDYRKYSNEEAHFFPKDILLRIESALCDQDMEYEYEMTTAIVDAVEAFSAESYTNEGGNTSTLEEFVSFLSLMFNCSKEVARKELFEIKLPKSVTTSMMASFMQNRVAATRVEWQRNGNKGEEVKVTPTTNVMDGDSSSPVTQSDEAKRDLSSNPNSNGVQTSKSKRGRPKLPKKPDTIKPSELLKKLNLPLRYKVFGNTVPTKPTLRKTENTIKADDANNIAYLQAAIERMTSDKTGQYYVLKALAEGSEAATEIYYPQIIAAYNPFERKPEQAKERIRRTQEAAATLLSKMAVPDLKQNQSEVEPKVSGDSEVENAERTDVAA